MDVPGTHVPAHISVPTERIVRCPWQGPIALERCERCPFLLGTLDEPAPVILCAYGHALPFHRPGLPVDADGPPGPSSEAPVAAMAAGRGRRWTLRHFRSR